MRKGQLLKTAALSSLLFAGTAAANVKTVPGEFIVKLKDSKSFMKSLKALGVKHLRNVDVAFGNYAVVKSLGNKSSFETLSVLNSNENIEYAEPNFVYSIVKPIEELTLDSMIKPAYPDSEYKYTPNDPKFGQLWGLKNTGDNEPGGSTGVAGADVNAVKAWGLTTGSRDVTIAVIDTGIDYNHPDLKDNMWTNTAELNGTAGVDDDGNGFVDDVYGYDFANNDGDPLDGHSHGTHCAGTIGAVHNNGLGVAGVMKDVRIMGIKFLTDSGSGTTEHAIKAIDYATKMNVDLMSNSWGGGGRSQALEDAIQRAADAGIVFTAAAGNSSTNNDSRPHYPSNYDVKNVVSVAALTAQNDLASFSCYGRSTVHIAAPGHKILSTVKNNDYKVYSGTSMATPHVSGVVGLLIAQEGRMDLESFRERLLATSVPVGALRGKTINGGRIDAYNLLTDSRPARNEPKPGDWVKVQLPSSWESAHPYANNATESKEFSVAGAKFIRLKVKKYEFENNYDYLQVANGSRQTVEKVSGSGVEYTSDYVEGDTMIVTFKSDRSINKWGFVIEEVEVQY
ncbi:MAG: S8 family serine peptidase [Bacteriovoracaceae bacterium]|nr:S8 family serine peptidase [Bacteriovoracaceae bacterium]